MCGHALQKKKKNKLLPLEDYTHLLRSDRGRSGEKIGCTFSQCVAYLLNSISTPRFCSSAGVALFFSRALSLWLLCSFSFECLLSPPPPPPCLSCSPKSSLLFPVWRTGLLLLALFSFISFIFSLDSSLPSFFPTPFIHMKKMYGLHQVSKECKVIK